MTVDTRAAATGPGRGLLAASRATSGSAGLVTVAAAGAEVSAVVLHDRDAIDCPTWWVRHQPGVRSTPDGAFAVRLSRVSHQLAGPVALPRRVHQPGGVPRRTDGDAPSTG
jgi:hypothetical protein